MLRRLKPCSPTPMAMSLPVLKTGVSYSGIWLKRKWSCLAPLCSFTVLFTVYSLLHWLCCQCLAYCVTHCPVHSLCRLCCFSLLSFIVPFTSFFAVFTICVTACSLPEFALTISVTISVTASVTQHPLEHSLDHVKSPGLHDTSLKHISPTLTVVQFSLVWYLTHYLTLHLCRCTL